MFTKQMDWKITWLISGQLSNGNSTIFVVGSHCTVIVRITVSASHIGIWSNVSRPRLGALGLIVPMSNGGVFCWIQSRLIYSLVTNSLKNPELDSSLGGRVNSKAGSLPMPIVMVPPFVIASPVVAVLPLENGSTL
jgi:hypothetical protein